jgi:folate-binding protein YgfZ
MISSILHTSLTAASARLVEESGVTTATDFGDARAEFAALRSACGVYDLSWRAKLLFTGSDRTRWLNGMLTNNVRDLAENQGTYAYLLNPQGHIQADLITYNRNDSIVVDSDTSQLARLREIFDHYIIMDDVEVADASERLTAIGLQGPKTGEILTATGIQPPALHPLELADLKWNNSPITLVRTEEWKRSAYEIWVEAMLAPSLWKAFVNAGAAPVGAQAQRWYRMASLIPRYGEDIRERDLPQETAQDQRALHFAKGCYVGQEIVERIHSRGQVRRTFTGFAVEGPPLAPGTKISADTKEVGEITSSAAIPSDNGTVTISLGYIRREAMSKPLLVDGVALKAHPSPFSELLKA